MGVLFKKPIFWIGIIIVLIIGLLILVLQSTSPKNLKNISPKISEKSKSGPKPGTCLILEQKHCTAGKLTDFNYQGQTLKIVGFHLPPDVPIFSPIDGSFGQTNMDKKPNTGPFHGFIALVFKPSDPSLLSFSIMGDIKFDNMLSHDVKKGDLIAYTQDTGIKNLGGNYNIIVTADRKNPNGNVPITITDEDMLRTMFPQAFEKSKK